MNAFSFNTARSIVFGSGTISRIGEIVLREIGPREDPRVAVITDKGLVASGMTKALTAALETSGLEIVLIDSVVADPPEGIIYSAATKLKDAGVDLVIGYGGGSSMDVAKLAALIAAGGEQLSDIYGIGVAKGPRLPLILIPTTAGTGSEVTPISIVTTGESEKKGVVTPLILPDVAILDPELTIDLPPSVTAATGIDAIVHAIESYASTSSNNNPLSQNLARQALKLLGGALLTAVNDGRNLLAREDMLLGAMLAGQAFANSPVAAVHALAYPIGGHFHVPHGLSNALVLPHVIRFNAVTAASAYADIAIDLFPNLEGLPREAIPGEFVSQLAELSGSCGLPTRLRDVGIPENALHLLATDAMKQTRLLGNNPRPLKIEDAFEIYRQAW
jgi:alcohol dehydrogenase class IV